MLLCRRRMAAEAALLVVGWVRRIATISRRMVVAAFLIYNIDVMCCSIACFAGRARRFGWLPWTQPLQYWPPSLPSSLRRRE